MDPGIRIYRLLSSVLLCLLLAAPTAEAEASRKPLQLTLRKVTQTGFVAEVNLILETSGDSAVLARNSNLDLPPTLHRIGLGKFSAKNDPGVRAWAPFLRLAARKLASRQHTVNRLLDRVESRGAIRPASPHAAVFLVDGEPVDLETRDWGRPLDEAFRAVLRDARWKSEDSVVVDFSPAKASATLDDSGRGRSPHLPAVCDSPEEWLK